MNKSKICRFFLIIIFFVGTIHVLWWGTHKFGFYVDELYTYGLSNSYMTPFYERTENYIDAYHKGSEFWDYLTVSEDDDFEFGSVWYNQERDVHPPFYYVLIHFVSSVFSGTFSKWIGLGINYVFYILSGVIFYKLSECLLKNEINRVLTVFMFVFSLGTLNTFLYVRMYMMLDFWILLYLLCMVKVILREVQKDICFWEYILIGSIIVCGFLTHYYFIIPAGIISLSYVIYCIIDKKIKRTLYYILTCLAAGVATQYIFEYSYNHIFIGYRGVEAIRNLKNANLFNNIAEMYDYINKQIFGGMLPIIFFGIVIVCIFLLSQKQSITDAETETIEEKKRISKMIWIKGVILITTIVFFFFVTKTTAQSHLRTRYLFPVYPFVMFSLSLIIDWILIRSKNYVMQISVITAVLVCVIMSYCVGTPKEFLFLEYAHIPEVIEENYKGSNAIYVTDCSYRHVTDCHILSMHDNIYIADFNTINHMEWFEDDEVILYINHWAYNPEVGEPAHDLEYYLLLVKEAEFESCMYLGETEHSNVYVLSR